MKILKTTLIVVAIVGMVFLLGCDSPSYETKRYHWQMTREIYLKAADKADLFLDSAVMNLSNQKQGLRYIDSANKYQSIAKFIRVNNPVVQ